MKNETLYDEAISQFSGHPIVTIAAGATCAYLGDERNLREFLIADEAARRLRLAGHTVFSLLIDDSFDPLTPRQLRVAMNKDEALIERHADWCGKPIGLLPDPFGCHPSFASHFEHALLDRLNQLGCNFNLVSTANLYERGLYAPYVKITLELYDKIKLFLSERFTGYQPEKLFWPLCACCGYMDETRVEGVQNGSLSFHCGRCDKTYELPISEARGKLNWKLDCAARWDLLQINAEPFNKAYLEPRAGAFVVAQALCQEFFGGPSVHPLRYGIVKMDKEHSLTLLASLPPKMLRGLMVERPSTDLTITKENIVSAAARCQVLPGTSFQSVIQQLLPGWLLTPETLSSEQRALVAHGIAFAENFLGTKVRMELPKRENFLACSEETRKPSHEILSLVSILRQDSRLSCEDFSRQIQDRLGELGEARPEVVLSLRRILGQERGLPLGRILYMLPASYVDLVTHMLELIIAAGHHPIQSPELLQAA